MIQLKITKYQLEPMPPEPTFPQEFLIDAAHADRRLDQFLARSLSDISRARVQMLIEQGKVLVDGRGVKSSYKLSEGERITVTGEVQVPALLAFAEDIPLEIVHEDRDLVVINKPAGMTVHAGAGGEEHNRGTLVNALLHRFQALSQAGGELRPGIVHRLDKETSGLILVARNDIAHRHLAKQFADRQIRKAYIALVHGWPVRAKGTINTDIARDSVRRTRMTVQPSRQGGLSRTAISHYAVLRQIDSPYGKFALLEVHIETGRTHQIRVHLSSIGHPVVGDTLYGAPTQIVLIPSGKKRPGLAKALLLERNFLHAAKLDLAHPRTGKAMHLESQLPDELENFFKALEAGSP